MVEEGVHAYRTPSLIAIIAILAAILFPVFAQAKLARRRPPTYQTKSKRA